MVSPHPNALWITTVIYSAFLFFHVFFSFSLFFSTFPFFLFFFVYFYYGMCCNIGNIMFPLVLFYHV
jgi:hypothetical protein